MSSYNRLTKNPDTGKWEICFWIDDYYGSHHYGVRFPDGIVVDPEIVKLEVKDSHEPSN